MDPNSSPFLYIEVPKSANPVAFPKDGIEYVKNVIIERQKCSGIVSVDEYDKKLNKCQNVFANVLPETIPAPDPLLPTKEWQIIQESDFSKVRCRLSSKRNEKEVWRSPVEIPQISIVDSPTLWRNFLRTHDPLSSIIFSMKQVDLEFALSVLIVSLEEVTAGSSIDRKSGQWIYALLAAFKQPLQPNLVSSLRDMARICSQIRSNLSPDAEDILDAVAPLNLFICLVARYFGQGDLAD